MELHGHEDREIAIAIAHQTQQLRRRMRGNRVEISNYKEVGGVDEDEGEGEEVTLWYLHRFCRQYPAKMHRQHLRLHQQEEATGGEED